jgi:hypothetical protein
MVGSFRLDVVIACPMLPKLGNPNTLGLIPPDL